MTTKLHSATLKDIHLILPLVTAYHAFEHIESTAAGRELAIRKLLMNPDFGGIWLIYSDDELAGYIALCRGYSIEFEGFDAFIDEFFLSSEFRGKGIGTEVLEAIKSEAKKLEINALHLEVTQDNYTAKRLYSKAGFEAREKYVLMSIKLGKELS